MYRNAREKEQDTRIMRHGLTPPVGSHLRWRPIPYTSSCAPSLQQATRQSDEGASTRRVGPPRRMSAGQQAATNAGGNSNKGTRDSIEKFTFAAASRRTAMLAANCAAAHPLGVNGFLPFMVPFV